MILRRTFLKSIVASFALIGVSVAAPKKIIEGSGFFFVRFNELKTTVFAGWRPACNNDYLTKHIDEHGILNPMLVTQNLEIIHGFRRYNCAKSLGWDKTNPQILVYVTDSPRLNS